MKLINIEKITGKITLKSGLHIGAGDTEMRIGGTDNSVVRHPHTLEPYIPGSSLKGKIRSLLELQSGLLIVQGDGKPVGVKTYRNTEGKDREKAEMILKLFGVGGAELGDELNLGPSRASFADCYLHEQCRERILKESLAFVEVKAETAIDRIQGTAKEGSLRTTERVPASIEFVLDLSLKKFEGDKDLEAFLLKGFKLLEMDALGGNGSRGYGRVEFEFDDANRQKRFKAIDPL